MKQQSAAANEVAINIKNIEDKSSTRISNQEVEGPPKFPSKNEGPPLPLVAELHFIFNEDESSTRSSNQQPEGLQIPKVPEMLRTLKINEGCFDPRVVSIGPYHHGKPHLQEVERLKTKLAKQYCGTPSDQVAYLYNRVKEVAGEARKFYDMKGFNIDDTAFTKMMFLDGCFILEFMCLLVDGKYDAMRMKNYMIANVKRDLFLLENQLPYIVLEELMKAKDDEKYWKERIEKFITICRRLPPAVKPEDKSPDLHLLDMTRKRFVKQSATDGKPDDWYSYYSARVLKSMGIRFRPNKTGSFSDVKFESQLLVGGVLTLSPIRIDSSTKSLLLNLWAFESSHKNSADMQGVTSYMCFMDSLIDSADDVMILRSQNVVVNCLGTDQQVADLFNNIASNSVPNRRAYAEAKLGIQTHCNNMFKKWMAECLHTHFRSPWTLLALCGAIFVILLTVAQTYFAAKPPKH